MLTESAAEEAGVVRGTTEFPSILGFSALVVRPGFIRRLSIGGVALDNVPVFVGDHAMLETLELQAALGIDLMHHLCWTLDYAAGKAFVEPADGALPEPDGDDVPWDIPLWTPASACVAQGRLGDRPVRVVLDSGNYAGTFVTPTWARRHLPGFDDPPEANATMTPFLAPPLLAEPALVEPAAIEGLEIAGVTLPSWPVEIAPDHEGTLASVFDVCMGYDLLGQYRVTIDLRRRVLRLVWAGETDR